MTTSLIAIVFCLTFWAVALWANARLSASARLPMQWWLNGDVTWDAPRPIALAFIPALSTIIMTGVALLSLYATPRPGQEHMLAPATATVGIVFLAVQLFHLWMAERTIRRNRR